MNQNKVIKYLYCFSLFMLIITGFGQMPVFKRYYIADIPGFGWLAQFYVTYILHYIFAILFVFIIFYIVTMFLGNKKKEKKIDYSTIFKSVIFGGLIITSFILVLRNLPGYRFSANFITITDFIHIGFGMMFLFVTPVFMIINRLKIAKINKGEL